MRCWGNFFLLLLAPLFPQESVTRGLRWLLQHSSKFFSKAVARVFFRSMLHDFCLLKHSLMISGPNYRRLNTMQSECQTSWLLTKKLNFFELKTSSCLESDNLLNKSLRAYISWLIGNKLCFSHSFFRSKII